MRLEKFWENKNIIILGLLILLVVFITYCVLSSNYSENPGSATIMKDSLNSEFSNFSDVATALYGKNGNFSAKYFQKKLQMKSQMELMGFDKVDLELMNLFEKYKFTSIYKNNDSPQVVFEIAQKSVKSGLIYSELRPSGYEYTELIKGNWYYYTQR